MFVYCVWNGGLRFFFPYQTQDRKWKDWEDDVNKCMLNIYGKNLVKIDEVMYLGRIFIKDNRVNAELFPQTDKNKVSGLYVICWKKKIFDQKATILKNASAHFKKIVIGYIRTNM